MSSRICLENEILFSITETNLLVIKKMVSGIDTMVFNTKTMFGAAKTMVKATKTIVEGTKTMVETDHPAETSQIPSAAGF